ncbi:Aquaporin [Streptococcus thermophilus CNCM I-1630]|nr:Aquaporin [Streptococcus thermophilus CNCM I-1630]
MVLLHNVELTGTKGNKSGWIVIAFGYGFGVMMPALMFGDVSWYHINPAFTLVTCCIWIVLMV